MFVLFSPTLGGTLDDFITRQNINWSTERAFVWNIKSHFPLPLTSAALPCTTPQPPTAPLVSLPLFPAGIRGGNPFLGTWQLFPCWRSGLGAVCHAGAESSTQRQARPCTLPRRHPAPCSSRATATRSRPVSTTQNVLSSQKDLILYPLLLKELLLCSVRGYHVFAVLQSRAE